MSSLSYTGVFLDNVSHQRHDDAVNAMPQVQEKLKEFSNPTLVAHHLTLTLGSIEELESFMGEVGQMTCTHLGISDKAIAVKCSPVVRFEKGDINWDNIPRKGNGKFPHITVFVNTGGGGKPVDSNKITDFIPLKQELTLMGKVMGPSKN